MAIIIEYYKTRGDDVKLLCIYSDQDLMIRQVETGNIYDKAIDVEGAPYTYEETNIPVEVSPEELLRIIEEGE